MELLKQIPKKEPVFLQLEGEVRIQGSQIRVGEIGVPRKFHAKFKARCKEQDAKFDPQEATKVLNAKKLFLIGREGASKFVANDWFGLVTQEFKSIYPTEVISVLENVLRQRGELRQTIRYAREEERYLANYRVGEMVVRGDTKYPSIVDLNLCVDSGEFGVYGGNGEEAVKMGVSVMSPMLSAWTLFLPKSGKREKLIHRKGTNLGDAVNELDEFSSEVRAMWAQSTNVFYPKGVVDQYLGEYGKRVSKGFLRELYNRTHVYYRGEGKISAFDLARGIADANAKTYSDTVRLSLEALAGEVITCHEEIMNQFTKKD